MNTGQLAKLFSNLSLIPLHNICINLDSCSLFLAASVSSNWRNVVENVGLRKESVWDVIITKHSVIIHVKFETESKKFKNFQICFKQDSASSSSSSSASEDVRIERDRRCHFNSLDYYHKTNSHLETTCLMALNIISYQFPPKAYGRFNVSLGPRPTHFPFLFLSNFPRGIAGNVDLEADLEVDGSHLMMFLRNVQVEDRNIVSGANRLDVGVRIKNLVICEEMIPKNKYFSISDARFLSDDSLKKLDFSRAEIGENNFTSSGFNSFLRSWMEDEKTLGLSKFKITFGIREDQKIEMKEVMKGLNAHVGKPRMRDRWKIEQPLFLHGFLHPTAIDMNQGWDFTNARGTLATVLLESNRLTFVTWQTSVRFHVDSFVILLEKYKRRAIRSIEEWKERIEKLEKKIAANERTTCYCAFRQLLSCEDFISANERGIVKCHAAQEKLKLWRNDD